MRRHVCSWRILKPVFFFLFLFHSLYFFLFRHKTCICHRPTGLRGGGTSLAKPMINLFFSWCWTTLRHTRYTRYTRHPNSGKQKHMGVKKGNGGCVPVCLCCSWGGQTDVNSFACFFLQGWVDASTKGELFFVLLTAWGPVYRDAVPIHPFISNALNAGRTPHSLTQSHQAGFCMVSMQGVQRFYVAQQRPGSDGRSCH